MATSSRSIRSPRVASARSSVSSSGSAGARRERSPRGAVEHRVGRDGAARPGRHAHHRAVPGAAAVRAGHPPGWAPTADRPRDGRRGDDPRLGCCVCRPVRGCSTASSATSPPRRCPDARIEAVGGLDVPIGDPAWPYPGPSARRRRTGDRGRRARPPSRCRRRPACPRRWSGCPSARRGPLRLPGPPGSPSRSCRCWSPSTRSSCCCRPGSGSTSSGPTIRSCPRYQRVAATAFAYPGGRRGRRPTCRWTARRRREPVPRSLRERIAAGRTVMMVAVENGRPVAVGSHQPIDIDGTEVSEVVGVATLPRLRGRGLGAGIASALVAHATGDRRHGVPGRRRRRRRPRLRAGRVRPPGHHRRRRGPPAVLSARPRVRSRAAVAPRRRLRPALPRAAA